MPAFPRQEMEEMMRRWLKANEDALKDTQEALHQALARHQKFVEEDTRLTNVLAGFKDPKEGDVKGLRQRIVEERVKLHELAEEQKFVRPLLINAFVESQLVLKRADALKARMRELGNVASGN